MIDFNFVTARLALGKHLKNDPANLQALVDAGITHIVCLQTEADDAPLLQKYATDIKYCHAPTDDDHTSKPNDWFQKVLEFVLPALSEPRTKVYIHCAAGISRSSSMLYAVLRALGHSRPLASWMLKEARPIVQINYQKDADRAVRELGYNDQY